MTQNNLKDLAHESILCELKNILKILENSLNYERDFHIKAYITEEIRILREIIKEQKGGKNEKNERKTT